MRVALLKSTRRLPVLILAVSCSSDGPAGMRPPFITTFDSVGDTIVASTTGDVPESLVRHLVVDWRVLTDTASEIIGDVHAMAAGSDGRYLGRIAAPRAVSLYIMRGDEVWGVVRDETDVPAIVRLRIDPALQER